MRRLHLPLATFFAISFAPVVHAQQIHRNGFEYAKTVWTRGAADAVHEVLEHATLEQGAHDGQRCEHIKIVGKQGSFVYFQYPLGKAPISDDLTGNVWIKANRPGIQLLARVVLPNERDPSNLETRLTTLIRGEVYKNTGRWQPLDLGRPVPLLREQQQLMQIQLKRPLNFQDAYIDALVLNVFGGPGPTEVWIDDLEIGPVADGVVPATYRPVSKLGQPVKPGGRGPQIAEFDGTQLLVGKERVFFRGIRYTDTPVKALRSAGFNTLHLDAALPAGTLKEAVDHGFWLVPTMRNDDARYGTPEAFTQAISGFPESDAVLFWHLGGTLAYEQATLTGRKASLVRQADPVRAVGADVWDGLMTHSRNLQLVGLQRWPLMTTVELPKHREWLEQRRRLAQNTPFVWAWIQTHMPDWYTQLLYERSANSAFDEPVGPLPEQIRLLTYLSLGTGCRGISFSSDRFLADSHQGRDRLLGVALLNQELDMLEPLLTTVDGAPEWIDTSVAQVKAAVFRSSRGILVVPMWMGTGAQFVPGQAAASKVTIKIPEVPRSTQAWEVCPVEVRHLSFKRVLGGTEITLNDFGLTSAVVFTGDQRLLIRLQEQAKARRQLAAQFSYDQALYEMGKIVKTQDQLSRLGQAIPDAGRLIADANARLRTAREHWDNHLFVEAYRESQRALRPLRILMRAQWEQATKSLDSPVASPYAVTFFTLPRHWQFMEQISKTTPSSNVLPDGNFEASAVNQQNSWRLDETSLDEVELLAVRTGEVNQPLAGRPGETPTSIATPHEGRQCLLLQVKPKARAVPPAALERTVVSYTSPSIRLAPGSLVQISGWIRIPAPITASVDGALLYDSAGGEPLAIRLTQPTPWKKFTLFRRVPASGNINVTLALTGVGSVYFDDVRIEPLAPRPNYAGAR